MKVLLYGPIAQRGRELLHDHFGDRIEITGTLAGDPAEQQAAHFAAAEVIGHFGARPEVSLKELMAKKFT